MICVLLLAAGAAWESEALGRLDRERDLVVLKRCVDVDDLLASATSGQAHAAVVDLEAPGLDPAAVAHLRRHAVRPVCVVVDTDDIDVRARADRLDVTALLGHGELDDLADTVRRLEDLADTRARARLDDPDAAGVAGAPHEDLDEMPEECRTVAVWGAAGAPGRTTVAVSLAAELGRRDHRTLLVDADPFGGAVAQQLGILDEVSGLLSAARLASAGELRERFWSTGRTVGDHLTVLTGLPRPDRWIEVRPGHLEQIVEVGRQRGHVVVDTGFSLDDEPGAELSGRPGRNALTHAAIDAADEVVVVGAADPVSLSRLARALVDLRDRTGGTPVRVVVNRMRSTLGWSETEIAGMVEGFTRISGLHFLPEDREAADRALVTGRSLVETGESALARALGEVVDALVPASVPAERVRRRSLRRRLRST